MNRSLGLIALFTTSTLLVTGCQEQVSMAEKMARPFQETLEMQQSIKHITQQGDQQRQELNEMAWRKWKVIRG